MPLSLFAAGVGTLFFLAYFVYGKRLSRFFALEESAATPAEKFNDGFDFVPTSKSVLLAQHFASIAAAGPVVGPIAAGLAFGWGPTLIWIVLGCTFIGACHDFTSLVASVRHDAKSIPELAKIYLGPLGYKLSLTFIWMCLIYVIIAFTDVTAQQFVAVENWGGAQRAVGGGVATSSLLYLVLSLLMGVAVTKWKMPLWLVTTFFVPLLGFIIFYGQLIPVVFPVENPTMAWSLFILAYCAVASLLPMWLLLQPRGFLGGFFLYAILIIGTTGLLFGGFSIEYPALRGFFSPKGESMFPFLFITVACGACSGFHGLVCSGTTSKQLHRETHAPLVGYGGMLLEGVVAVMALATVMIWPLGDPTLARSPAEIYATGIANFAHAVFGLDPEWGLTFGMLAFATFVYDTLDVATRLGRYLMEELFSLRGWRGRVIATAATLAVPLVYVLFTPAVQVGSGAIPLWSSIWPLFGSSNQLLAALTLLLMTIWVQQKRSLPWWLFLPAVFMFATASIALTMQLTTAARALLGGFTATALLNAVLSGALLALSAAFCVACYQALRLRRQTATIQSNGT